MYSVSADYLTALSQPFHKYKLTGMIGTEAFDEANIVSGSLSVTNKVSEGSEIKLGSVYTGELRATFSGLNIARGAWVGKAISLSEGLQLADTTYEYVPLGTFYVSEAKHTAEGVEVVAYDAMTNFDKTASQTKIPAEGGAYDYLKAACNACGVTLANSLANLMTFPNGDVRLNLHTDNDIETWRDVVGWIAQTLCAISTINRNGQLELRQYSMSSSMTIDETQRFTGCEFSDFATNYTGMSCVNIVTRHTVYKSVSPDDGLTYNLGSNPFVQDDFDLVQEIIDDFFTVSLTPFSAQMLGGAIFDLCDCLTFTGGIAQGAVGGVMGYTWKYNGAYSVKGFGSNPALASAKSKTEKNLEGLFSTVAETINEVSIVQNADAVSIADGSEVSILTYNFEVTQDVNTTLMDVSVAMTASATETVSVDVYTLDDIAAQLHIYVDNVEMTVYDPVFIVDEGKDTMTFNYSLSGLTVGAHELDVRIEMAGGSGAIAADDVHEMLWGYGITFEVYMKALEVAQMPTKVLYVTGQNLDLTGLSIDGVYNNGLRDDVTADCSYYPTDGTALTDLGTVTVDASLTADGNLLQTSFDVTVAELVMFIRNVQDFGALGNVCESENMGLYVRCLKTAYGSSAISLTLYKAQIDDSADVPVFTNYNTIAVSLSVANSTNSLLYATLDELMYVISVSYTGNVNPRNVMYDAYEIDMLNNTTNQLTIAYDFVNPPYEGMTIDGIEVSTGKNMVVVDGYMIVACEMYATYNGSQNSYSGYAYATISGSTITWHFVTTSTSGSPARYSNFYNNDLSLYSNPGMTAGHTIFKRLVYNNVTGTYWLYFAKMTFSIANGLQYREYASIDTGSISLATSYMVRVIGNTNQILVKCSSNGKWYLIDEDEETAKVLTSFLKGSTAASPRVIYTTKYGGIIPDKYDEVGMIFWWDALGKYAYVDDYDGVYVADKLDGTWELIEYRFSPSALSVYSNMSNFLLSGTKLHGLMASNSTGVHPASLCLGE